MYVRCVYLPLHTCKGQLLGFSSFPLPRKYLVVYKTKSQTFYLPNEDSGARHCDESLLAQRGRGNTQLTPLLRHCAGRKRSFLLLHTVFNTLQPSIRLSTYAPPRWLAACSAF